MTTIYLTTDTRKRDDGLVDVYEVEREGTGANPFGKILSERLIVEAVTPEYATALENAHSREKFAGYGDYAAATFGHAGYAARRARMFAADNPHFAECVKTALVY